MKQYIIFTLFLSLLFSSCYEDLGNYEYHDINELVVTGVSSSYSVSMDVGSLIINPVIQMTQQDPDDPRFEYSWVVKRGSVVVDTIGHTRNINWRASLPVATYSLFFKVMDRITGITDVVSSTLNIVTYHNRGIMLIGENAQGNAQAQMIVMVEGQEEVFYDDILQYSGLPTLQGPINFFHSGNYGTLSNAVKKLWIATESGSYFLNNLTLQAESNYCTFDAFFPFAPSEPLNLVEMAPKISANNGNTGGNGYRYFLCSNGNLYGTYYLLTGDEFDSPLNKLPGPPELIPASGPLLYALITTQTNVLWYDKSNQRFLKLGNPLTMTTSELLVDNVGEIFPWNQNGRTYVYGENTRSTDQGATGGNSFAIMRETTINPDREYDYCIYKLYCGATALKQGFYTINKSEAPLFGTGTQYAFSSTRAVLFYIANGKLYAYDYNPVTNRNYEIALADNNEVTMVMYDHQREPGSEYLYVATYSASTGGTLYKYSLDNDLNTVRLESTPRETWTGTVKLRNMSWRGGE